jgi:hypothetical protein
MSPRKPPRELTAAERAHVAALQEKFGDALSMEQIEANFRMSLGLPDANGRTPSAREQLGALKLFADLLIAKPRPEDAQAAVTFLLRDPFCTCPPCSCGASKE